jgi:hypothetical protein
MRKDLDLFNEVVVNDIELKEFITDLCSYDAFIKKINDRKVWLDCLANKNNPIFEILSFKKTHTLKDREKSFLWLYKDKFTFTEEIVTRDDVNFYDLLTNRGDYYIHSILRKSDNVILTIGDITEHFLHYCDGGDGSVYDEEIYEFCLDGDLYVDKKLSSKSGIQAFFGGGSFLDISQVKLKK